VSVCQLCENTGFVIGEGTPCTCGALVQNRIRALEARVHELSRDLRVRSEEYNYSLAICSQAAKLEQKYLDRIAHLERVEQLYKAAKRDNEDLKRQADELLRDNITLKDGIKGSAHFWQGDGSDRLEEIHRPVLMRSSDLRQIMKNRDDALTDAQRWKHHHDYQVAVKRRLSERYGRTIRSLIATAAFLKNVVQPALQRGEQEDYARLDGQLREILASLRDGTLHLPETAARITMDYGKEGDDAAVPKA
jgi:hypothetical protein